MLNYELIIAKKELGRAIKDRDEVETSIDSCKHHTEASAAQRAFAYDAVETGSRRVQCIEAEIEGCPSILS
jgi:cell fate (sporulation/competence/biofilm development) regulator YmcA (YheA/YmcA/DUF963 family)